MAVGVNWANKQSDFNQSGDDVKLSAQDKLQTVVQVHLLKNFPYRSEVAVFYLSIVIFCYFILSL